MLGARRPRGAHWVLHGTSPLRALRSRNLCPQLLSSVFCLPTSSFQVAERSRGPSFCLPTPRRPSVVEAPFALKVVEWSALGFARLKSASRFALAESSPPTSVFCLPTSSFQVVERSRDAGFCSSIPPASSVPPRSDTVPLSAPYPPI